MFRVFIGRDPDQYSVQELEDAFDDWVESNAQWTEDAVAHVLTERNTDIDGSGETYYGGDVRFLEDDSKDNLLQKFTDKFENKVKWYKVGYHACTHRDGDGSSGPCSWDDKDEWTDKDQTIPSGVPDFDIS